jgi:homocitrate synthase NifV
VSNFHPALDLMDETLREGAERASISASIEEKYELGKAISDIGIRSLVVGMFPDVPHNIELLKHLIRGQRRKEIDQDTRFLVISHVGGIFNETLRVLNELGEPLDSVWIIVIHSVSDLQIRYLFPKVVLKRESPASWDAQEWAQASVEERRKSNLEWLDKFLPTVSKYKGGGAMLGLLDSFRADPAHLRNAVSLVTKHGIKQIRLVDTAGTCMPQQIDPFVGALVRDFPDVGFYCHFHDDFGMATGNALHALSLGARGADVSVGGFANRAGHAALAEVVMGLYYLYGVVLPDFKYDRLTPLSRLQERTYGLMERPTQPITGMITHGILSGIRTELVGEAADIFDIIDPLFVGSKLSRMFGARSGRDGVFRFLEENAERLSAAGVATTRENADRIFAIVNEEWEGRSRELLGELRLAIQHYYQLLNKSVFTETEMLDLILKHYRRAESATSQ